MVFYTAKSLASALDLHRLAHNGTILVVEGDSDQRLLKRFVDDRVCLLLIAGDKHTAIRGVNLAIANGVSGVLALVDRDYDLLAGIELGQNVITWQDNDLESTLLRSDALPRVLDELASRPKINALDSTVPELLSEMAAPIGALRWLSIDRNLGLNFTCLKHDRLYDRRTCLTNTERLVQQVLNCTNAEIRHTNDELLKLIQSTMDAVDDPWSLVCGHDAIEALSVALRLRIGNNRLSEVAAGRLESDLRLAFGRSDLTASGLEQQIARWESSNPPFRIMASGNRDDC